MAFLGFDTVWRNSHFERVIQTSSVDVHVSAYVTCSRIQKLQNNVRGSNSTQASCFEWSGGFPCSFYALEVHLVGWASLWRSGFLALRSSGAFSEKRHSLLFRCLVSRQIPQRKTSGSIFTVVWEDSQASHLLKNWECHSLNKQGPRHPGGRLNTYHHPSCWELSCSCFPRDSHLWDTPLVPKGHRVSDPWTAEFVSSSEFPVDPVNTSCL